jgi:hypothetical protein
MSILLVLAGDAALKKELLKFMAEHPSVARFAVSNTPSVFTVASHVSPIVTLNQLFGSSVL